MRKNDLIKILQAFPGNPEIKLWNGVVGDIVDIKPTIVECRMVKQSLSDYIERCQLEECRDRNDWLFQYTPEEIAELTKIYNKNTEWEINQYIDEDRIKNKDYLQKKIYVIDAKQMGKEYWDRAGTIRY